MIGVALKRPHVRVKRKIDYLGAGLLTVSATAFLLVMSLGGTEFAWDSLQSLAFALVGIIFGIAFVWRERTADEPLLPLSLFKNKTFLIGSFVLACMFLSTQGANIFYPLFFQVVNGIAATKSGLLTVPLPLGMLVAARFNGRLMMKTGRYKPSQLFGVSLAVISFLLLTWATATGQSLWVVEPILACVGLSLGSTMPGMQVAVQSAVEKENMGVAMATMTFFRSLGGVLGVALSGVVLTHTLAAQAEATVLPAGIDVRSFLDAGIIQINAFSPAMHALAIEFYRHAIAASFSAGIVATALALIALLFLPEVELRATDAAPRGGAPGRNAARPEGAGAMPPAAGLPAE
jgi:Na+/melibiose symporter-like transporter